MNSRHVNARNDFFSIELANYVTQSTKNEFKLPSTTFTTLKTIQFQTHVKHRLFDFTI